MCLYIIRFYVYLKIYIKIKKNLLYIKKYNMFTAVCKRLNNGLMFLNNLAHCLAHLLK